MTEITHHISDPLLMCYSAGALPPAFDLVVESHLALNPPARTRLSGFDSIGGSLLEDQAPVPVAAGSLQATLARAKAAAPTPRRAAAPGIFPAPLQRAVGGDVRDVTWRPIARGVKQAILHRDPDATVRLLYIPAGQAMPRHTHAGTELTLVLQGAYRDESGRFARGDLDEADDEIDHTPVAEEGMDCICLAATEAPLRFHTFLPRVAQRFLKI